MAEVPAYWGEERTGTVRIEPRGGWTEVTLICRRDDRGLFRGFLRCAGGEVPLGVLVPEGDAMRAARRLASAELAALGPPLRGESRMSFPFTRDSDGWLPVTDGFFRRRFLGTLRHTEGALWRPAEEGRQLALPWDCGAPFPLVELLCFVRVAEIRRSLFGLILFDGGELPRMPG